MHFSMRLILSRVLLSILIKMLRILEGLFYNPQLNLVEFHQDIILGEESHCMAIE